MDLSQHAILMIAGAFLVGWILATISARMRKRGGADERDPREQRILALEAELRVAQSDAEIARGQFDELKQGLDEATQGIEKRDNVIAHQQATVAELKNDLKESVAKTRQLRSELTDRATQSVRSEAKLREVETELSVAQASSDMIATGVLDYSLAPDKEELEIVSDDDDENR